MIDNDHIVLLGSAGVGAAYASAKALRKYYKVKIVTVDTNPSYLVTANLLSDYFEQIPTIACKDFGEAVIRIIDKYNIDTYIPYIDQEVYRAAVLYENGKINSKVCLQVKNSSFAEICWDKYSTYIWLKTNGYPTPETFDIKDKSQLREGYILKPRNGFGSVIHKIGKDSDMKIGNFDELVMQEYCNNPEITIDVHYSKKFDFFAFACRERIETKSGVCTKARIFNEPYLGEIALSLAKKLDLSSFCFQVMNINNEYMITDINPRLGAGTAMSVVIGLDFFASMFATLWDQNPEKYFTRINEEKYVTRQYCEFIM